MKLYRYRKPNLDHLKSEILNDEFYLWSLNNQNDPFEGRLIYNDNLSQDSLYESLANSRKLLQNQQSKHKEWLLPKENINYLEKIKSASDLELKEMAQESIARGDYDQNGIKLIKAHYEKMTDHLVMSCFSLRKNNPVMFAHYADNHKGVCLEYDVDERDFFKVEYVDQFPKLNIFNLNDELVMKYRTYTKHADWEYEREYRLLLYNRPPGLYSNERIKLKAIYLGLNSSNETKIELSKLVSIKKESTKLYSLVIQDDNYELSCKQIV